MGSKMVLDRKKSSVTVVSAGEGYGDKMAAGFTEIFGPVAGEAVRTLVTATIGKLGSDTEAMVRADEANLNELADDAQVLAGRDTHCAGTRSLLIELREGATAAYGPDLVRALGFKGDTPTDPVAVESLATQVLANLDGPAALSPKPIRTGLSMDLSAFKAPLAEALPPLTAALEAVAADKREGDKSIVEKRRTMEQYDKTFSITANLISELLRAAGETELSRRVRPSTRKPGQTQNEEQPETPPGTPAED